MKILRIWHAAVVAEYRKKVRAIANFPDVDLTLLIPRKWKEGGKEVYYQFDEKIDTVYSTVVGRIARQNNIRRYFFLTGLWKTMKQTRPDVIDLEEEPYSYVARQVIYFRNLLGLNSKIIFHSATNIQKQLKNPFAKIQENTFSEASAAIVRNQEAESYLQNNGFNGPIFLSGNGIDCNHFSPGDSSKLREKFNLGDKKVVGFVGNLRTGKGLFTLLSAFEKLPKDTVLLLIGGGHLFDDIKRIANSKGFAERLILTGQIDHMQLPDYYRLMDVFVLPSETGMRWKESFGRVLIEAMACGIPVIGSSSGAIPDTILDAGIVFSEKNVKELVEAINKLLIDKGLLQKYKKAGLQRAGEFSWDSIAKINYEVYQSVFDK